MSKQIKLYANSIGGDIHTMSLFHTSVNASNLLVTGVTPTQLNTGVTVTVADSVTKFFAKVTDSGSCNNTTSSFTNTLFQPNKRYFNVANSGSSQTPVSNNNTVQINYPVVAGPTSGSLEQTVSFIDHASFIIEANFVYPDYTSFLGWYTDETGGTLISTNNPLTITQNTFTASDSFWARHEGFTKTYNISSSKANVDEGDSVTFTLTTTNVDGGTNVPYTITGITSADLSGSALTGNFNVVGQTAAVTVNIDADTTTEGQETMTIDLDDVVCSPVSVIINDTSQTPAPTYSLSAATPVDEGDTVVFTLTTSNVADGTVLPFTITGVSAADLTGGTLTGNFTVNSNTAQTILSLVADKTTEGTETMTLALDNGGASQGVSVNDTSILVGTIIVNSGTYTVSNATITGSYVGTLQIAYTVTTADVTLGAPRVWTSGRVKSNAGFIHNPIFYGINPTEKTMATIGTVSPGTYSYTSSATFTGYTGVSQQHGATPGTGSNLLQEAYTEVVTFGSGPDSWSHVGTGFTNNSIPLTFA
mgnify:CR=1 FL=1